MRVSLQSKTDNPPGYQLEDKMIVQKLSRRLHTRIVIDTKLLLCAGEGVAQQDDNNKHF